MGRFSDKVVIVTGSSNGIGRATALLFGKEGAKVTITGRNAEALKETRSLLLTAGVPVSSILEVVGDIIDEAVQRRLVDETIKTFGKLNILVNNAGGHPQYAGATGFAHTSEHFDYLMNLNTKAPSNIAQLAHPHLKVTQGEIVNVSSIAALPFAVVEMPYYAAAKAALDQISRALAIIYLRDGIRVNSLNPGLVSTKIIEKQGLPAELAKQVEAHYAKHIPIHRAADPAEMATVIAFLADRSQSSYIVGQNITADGGISIVPGAFGEDDIKQKT